MSSTFPHSILLVPLNSFLTLTTRYVIARGVGPRLFLAEWQDALRFVLWMFADDQC